MTPCRWGHQEKALAEHPTLSKRNLKRLHRVNVESPLAQHLGIGSDDWGYRGAYGLSETFTLATAFPANAPAALRRASAGPPLPGMQLRILDPECGSPVEDGDEGEIAVRGLTLMRGYYKVNPELTFDRDGFFHTQDDGRLDTNGQLHWKGRLSNMIKTGGANVSPLELESALEGFPGLHSVHAIGVPHPTLGEAIVLCAAALPDTQIDEASIVDHLRKRLAPYKVPKRVLAFDAEDLSFTGSQKVQLDPLRKAALQRLGDAGTWIADFQYGGKPEDEG